MGHKKRNPVARPKQSPAVSPESLSVAASDSSAVANGVSNGSSPKEIKGVVESPPRNVSSGGGVGSASFTVAKAECERAMTTLRRGNHTKALRLMKELCQRNESSTHSALIQRVQGTISVKVAALIDDPASKSRHMRAAVEAARKAAELSPNSIEFAFFHANLLYEVANETKEYEDAVRECERGLAIESPVDPAKDSLNETEAKLASAATAEERVAQVQNDLRQLIQKSNIASISSWMKNLGSGDEKFRLIPIRRVAEDPMELRLVQSRRPNDMKKATKTPEERRKEIEVRVAAARLMQQNSLAPQLENGTESSPMTGQRAGERRKSNHARKNGSSAERKDHVRSFWDSISVNAKGELLRVRVSDLKEHFRSSKEGLAIEVLSEALSFAETHRSWKFWVCCKCSEVFANSESLLHHLVQDHMKVLLPKQKSVLPQSVDDEWSEMLLSHSWKPLDVLAAIKMVKNQSKCKGNEFAEKFPCSDYVAAFDMCYKDTGDYSLEEGNLGDISADRSFEKTGHEKISNAEPMECEESNGSVPYSFIPESWPVSDDTERAKLLERIRCVFEVLIKNKCLTDSHLSRVVQFTIDELRGITSGSQLYDHGVQLSPTCFCFLGEPQLKKICKFLQDIAHSCGLGTRYTEKSNSLNENTYTGIINPEIKEWIVLSGDSSCLLLDEGLLGAESAPLNNHHGPANNANGVLADSNGMLSWIFAGPASSEELSCWMRTKDEKAREGVEILQRLETDFDQLQSLCEQKCEHLAYEEALQNVEDLCLEEAKRRGNSREFLYQSYDSVLKKRINDLLDNEQNEMFPCSRVEYDTISQILKAAETLSINQFGYDETYGAVSSQLCDLESGDDDDWRPKDFWHQSDTCVEVALQRRKDQLYVELSKVDARIMRSVTEMQQIELKLGPVAAHDYRSILLPLVKSYMRAHLEDLAEKDATEKSDAVRDALLAELDLDSKKASKGGNDNTRQTQDKAKDKKKNKESRKSKDLKVTSVSEPQVILDETDESLSNPFASDDNHMDSMTVSVNGDELKRQQEENRRKIELEEEERKLEETLEYQRQIESEAKQKHLAEQLKKANNQTDLKKVTEGLDGAHPESSPFDIGANEQTKASMQELLVNNLDSLSISTPNSPDQSLSPPVSSPQVKSSEPQTNIQQVALPNGGTSEDGYLTSERRGGKRARRQRGSAKVLEKHQLPPAKEAVDAGNSVLEGGSKEDDNGSKSLRQLRAEDDEERFQADLEKAVQQSLDTFQALKKMPSASSLKMMQRNSREVEKGNVAPNDVRAENANGDDIIGTGLKNEVGEYNCFLNVIIQSLWHIKVFRDEFLLRSSPEHKHGVEPCVVRALYEVFSALSEASAGMRREGVAPTALRVALSKMYPDKKLFQENEMNDASEVLSCLFECLHDSFATPVTKPAVKNFMGTWDCTDDLCIAHSIFGMDIFERMNCYNCELESRYMKYTTFFHNINATSLRTMKVMCADNSFDKLINLVEMNDQLACDPEAAGCGKLNYTHRILSSPPRVFITVLGWQTNCETAEDISTTLSALSTEIDIGVFYRGLEPKNLYNLVSVVCYYGQHYHCFAYSHDHGRWIMYDDQTVKVIGSWTDVLAMCEKGHLQPQVFFYEAVNQK